MADASLLGLVGYLAALVAAAFAVFLYRANPDAPANRRLATVLAFEGVFMGFLGTYVLFFAPDPPDGALSLFVVAGYVSATAIVPWFYLFFLGTLGTPWVAPFAGRHAATITMAGVVGSTLGVAWLFIAFDHRHPALAFLGPGAYMAASLYALGASISAWRRAPRGSVARNQAKAFAVAFGARDIIFGLFFGRIVLNELGVWATGEFPGGLGPQVAPPFVLLVYVPLIAYGILKWQLFGIDLAIKFTVKQTTLAAIFIAAFFVVSEGAQALLEDRTGSTILGVLGAGLLVLFLAPLQRFADKVASAAVPNAEPTSEYFTFRKFEIYRATLERALADGTIRTKERAMLDGLRSELGIAAADAKKLETEAARLVSGGVGASRT